MTVRPGTMVAIIFFGIVAGFCLTILVGSTPKRAVTPGPSMRPFAPQPDNPTIDQAIGLNRTQ